MTTATIWQVGSGALPVSRTIDVPENVVSVLAGLSLTVQRLPTEPVGTTTVTFDGVPAGLEIRVYGPGEVEYAGIESCSANQELSWPVYALGSENNHVQVKIVSFDYKIKDFTYTSKLGAQSIPIQMELDPWSSDPP